MLKIIFYLFCAAVLVSFSTACADSEGAPTESVEDASGEDAPDAPAETIGRDAFPRAYAEVICGRIFGCCTDEELENSYRWDGDLEAQCLEHEERMKRLQFARSDESREAGRMGFNMEKAAACINALRDAACEQGLTERQIQPKACAELDIPLMDAGEDCMLDNNCHSNRCEGAIYDEFNLVHTMGTCLPVVGLGTPCEWDIECEVGLICSAKYNPETGERIGVCRAYSGDGEPCDSQRACAEGTYCMVSAEALEDGVCKAYAAPGEPCGDGVRCGDGIRCTNTSEDPDAPLTCPVATPRCVGRD